MDAPRVRMIFFSFASEARPSPASFASSSWARPSRAAARCRCSPSPVPAGNGPGRSACRRPSRAHRSWSESLPFRADAFQGLLDMGMRLVGVGRVPEELPLVEGKLEVVGHTWSPNSRCTLPALVPKPIAIRVTLTLSGPSSRTSLALRAVVAPRSHSGLPSAVTRAAPAVPSRLKKTASIHRHVCLPCSAGNGRRPCIEPESPLGLPPLKTVYTRAQLAA